MQIFETVMIHRFAIEYLAYNYDAVKDINYSAYKEPSSRYTIYLSPE